jgi:hypothetical protein
MPFTFGPIQTADTYQAGATFQGFPASQRITLRVQGQPVYMQLQYGLAGSWGAEELVSPGWPSLVRPLPFTGVRFRSAAAGNAATISGTASEG